MGGDKDARRGEGEHGLQRRSAGGQGRRGDSPPGSGDRTAHGGGRKLLACPPGDGGRQGQAGEFARPRGTGGARARVCQVGGVGSRVTAEVVAVGRLAFRRRKRRGGGERRERSAGSGGRARRGREGGREGRGSGERRQPLSARRACGAGWVTRSSGARVRGGGGLNYCRLCWWWRLPTGDWRGDVAQQRGRHGAARQIALAAAHLGWTWGLPRC